RLSSATTSRLFALWLWSSRANSSRWTSDSLLETTSRAAIFSLTKRTVFPRAMHSAMILAMVWLLPVPGGPLQHRSHPLERSLDALLLATVGIENLKCLFGFLDGIQLPRVRHIARNVRVGHLLAC